MADQLIGVCVIVLNKDRDKILLGKRKNAYRAGSYGLPGGRVNITEPLVECAVRELREETNLTASSLQYIGVVRELQNNYNFIHFVYASDKYLGTIETKESEKCEEWKWYSFSDVPTEILPGHKGAIELFKKNKTSVKEILY